MSTTADARRAAPDTPPGPDAEALRRLVRAVRDLAAARDLDDVIDVVRSAARELVEADGATFVLRDDDHCYYVGEDAMTPLWRGQRFPLHQCVSGWAMLNDEAVAIPDIYADDRVPHAAYRPTFVRSMMMTPVRSDAPIAAIGTYWSEEREFTAAETDVLQALADSTSVAMEKINVLEELEIRVAARTAELEATNRDLASFAQVAAHDLKAPLATISGYAELVEDTDGDSLSPAGIHALELIQRQSTRMAGMIDAVLAYSVASTTPLEQGRLDLADLVAGVLRDLQDEVTSRSARVEVDPLPVALGSAPLVERVVQNLVLNAIRYGDPDRPLVRVTGAEDGGLVSIRVRDNGAGLGPGEEEQIFDMFTRGRAAAQASGSGIGLAFARRVVTRHGGTLTAENHPEGGACFTMTLPGWSD